MILKFAIANKALGLLAAGALTTATTAAAVTGTLPVPGSEDTIDASAVVESADEVVVDIPLVDDAPTADDELVETVVDEPPTDESTEGPDLAVGEGPVDDEGVPYGIVACDDAETHGEYVSGVAHDERLDHQGKGTVMRDAAQTECGKDVEDDDIEDDDIEDEDEDEGTDADSDDDEIEVDDEDDEGDRVNRGGGRGTQDEDSGNQGSGNGNKAPKKRGNSDS